MHSTPPRVLLAGASGFIGRRLLRALTSEKINMTCLTRTPENLAEGVSQAEKIEVVQGDLLKPETLGRALESIDTAFYLVHSMGEGYRGFVERDRQAAENFVKASDKAGLRRIIYLSGLGETDDALSPHLTSRQEVGKILRTARAETTVLRAGVIIGAGSASFEMLRYLMERHPTIVCPPRVHTCCQPIAVQNVIDYLAGCLRHPATAGRTLDIGGPEIISYYELMRIYARVRCLIRFIFTLPVFTSDFYAHWMDLVTPVPLGIVKSLIEGLKNETVCRDHRIRDLIPLELISMEDAICTALVETEKGPGRLASRASCCQCPLWGGRI